MPFSSPSPGPAYDNESHAQQREREAQEASDAEYNDAITCAYSLINRCLRDVRIQAKGHPGDWSETLDYLTTAAETLPRMK